MKQLLKALVVPLGSFPFLTSTHYLFRVFVISPGWISEKSRSSDAAGDDGAPAQAPRAKGFSLGRSSRGDRRRRPTRGHGTRARGVGAAALACTPRRARSPQPQPLLPTAPPCVAEIYIASLACHWRYLYAGGGAGDNCLLI